MEDFLQPETAQITAGYVLYATSTILACISGNSVNGFTLNPTIGTFYLSHPNLKFPLDGAVYSVNEGNYVHFPIEIKDYIKYCQTEKDDRPYTSRYIGSLAPASSSIFYSSYARVFRFGYAYKNSLVYDATLL